MAQKLKTRNKKLAGDCQADQRVIELVKYLARCAAKRNYEDIQSKSAFDGGSHGDTGEDS